jgi:HEAT repeat protein
LTKDASPYVRLAALHALAGSTDRGLAPMLQTIAAHDGDAGVRALAQQVLASLNP